MIGINLSSTRPSVKLLENRYISNSCISMIRNCFEIFSLGCSVILWVLYIYIHIYIYIFFFFISLNQCSGLHG